MTFSSGLPPTPCQIPPSHGFPDPAVTMVDNEDLRLFLLVLLRYILRQRTYATSLGVNLVLKYKDVLRAEDRVQMRMETREEINNRSDNYIDVTDFYQLLEKL